eukprot:g4921.t1
MAIRFVVLFTEATACCRGKTILVLDEAALSFPMTLVDGGLDEDLQGPLTKSESWASDSGMQRTLAEIMRKRYSLRRNCKLNVENLRACALIPSCEAESTTIDATRELQPVVLVNRSRAVHH